MSAWLKRFGLHLAAAVGATGIFVAAAAVGASQTRQAPPIAAQTAGVSTAPSPQVVPRRTPGRAGPPPSPSPTAGPGAATSTNKVAPERSLAGTVREVLPDGLDVIGVGGHEWHVVPAPGALIRLNGHAAKLDTIVAGDTVVILGQAEAGPGSRFLAHAITARQK